MKLSLLPNIGKVLEKGLNSIGINNPDRLSEIGSVEAFRKMEQIGPKVCLNKLYALEGAIRGIRWHALTKETKQELKDKVSALDFTRI